MLDAPLQGAELTVDEAAAFFEAQPPLQRPLGLLQRIGLGYLRLGQPATELSGGEAQRIKLATELQRTQRGDTLYVLDEPTTGLHPADADRLLAQLRSLVAAGNTVVLVEHDMRVVAAFDWVIDLGPGAGAEGGRIVAAGPPEDVAASADSRTAPYLRECFDSLLGQQYRDIEVIAIDDASTDDSLAICREYEAAHPNFRCISKANEGGAVSGREALADGVVGREQVAQRNAGEVVTDECAGGGTGGLESGDPGVDLNADTAGGVADPAFTLRFEQLEDERGHRVDLRVARADEGDGLTSGGKLKRMADAGLFVPEGKPVLLLAEALTRRDDAYLVIVDGSEETIIVAAGDPLNLSGILVPGPRIPPASRDVIAFRDGAVVETGELGAVRSRLGQRTARA